MSTPSARRPPDWPASLHLPTPCLLIDVEAADRNIARAVARRGALDLRPHFKAHKCTTLLRRQIAAGGCRGVTCATADEALVLATSGFDRILLANEVANTRSLDRLMSAAERAHVTVAVDAVHHVTVLAEWTERAGVDLEILIDIDVGQHRCGILPGSESLHAIAMAVHEAPRLMLAGIMGYEGHAALESDPDTRRRHVWVAGRILAEERRRLESAGYPCRIVSGGASGTLDEARDVSVLTEAQIGSYVLLDAAYERLALGYEPAVFCIATVISRPSPSVAILDAGLKAMSGDAGPPRSEVDGLDVVDLHDEHAVVRVGGPSNPRIGEVVPLIPGHLDPTLNLHDAVYAWHPDGLIELWPIDGRRRQGGANLSQEERHGASSVFA